VRALAGDSTMTRFSAMRLSSPVRRKTADQAAD
jgi:hypothetical protein